MSEEDAYEYTVQLQRGEGTDDRDKHKCKVTANSIDALQEKVEQARDLMKQEVEETREIQVEDRRSNGIAEDHQTFEEYKEADS